MENLTGGREGITRKGDVVIRPAGPWSVAVHKFLKHLHDEGFHHAPIPLGLDSNGNEQVSFVAGTVNNYPYPSTVKSEEALVSAAKLLRNYHDAAESFITPETRTLPWMMPAREPSEVIVHGDYAPYNVALKGNQAVGMIDFDTAHPAPRLWDIAYAVYRWAPLSDQEHAFVVELGDQIQRTKLFCDAYDLKRADRERLVQTVIERMNTFVNFMRVEAANGNEKFIGDLRDGHHLIYLKDINYLTANRKQIVAGIL